MTLISRHPYSFLFAGAGVVLLVIVLFAQSRSVPSSSSGSFTPVSAGGALINPGLSTPEATRPSPSNNGELAPANLPLPLSTGAATMPAAVQNPPEKSAVSGSGGVSSANTSASLVSDNELLKQVYALMSLNLPTSITAQQRTPEQQALFEYGNEAGLAILTFQNAHTDMADVLTLWLADRSNPLHAADVGALADGLVEAGQALQALPSVPAAAISANTALANALQDAGAKLKAVVAAGSDDTALVETMKTYDASVETFTREYLAVVDLFSLQGIKFSGTDAGSVFQFSSAGSL